MRVFTAAGVVVALLCARAAWAQDQAAAEAAWQEGRRLMQEKKYEQACAKFATSQKLDPAIGTLLNLGDCKEKLGKTASAWVHYMEAESMARHDKDAKRQQSAHERVERLAPKLVKLQIDLAPGAQVSGVKVKRDGQTVDEGLLGTAIPVDPGEHVVSAEAPGLAPFSQKVAATTEGKTFTVTVPKLEPTGKVATKPRVEPKKVETTGPAVPELPPAATDQPAAGPRKKSRVILALAVGGGGVAFLGVGAIFGFSAISTWNDSKSHCDTNTLCDQVGYDQVKDAQSKATISNVFVGLGVAALATGAILYFTAPREHPAETALRVVPELAPGRVAVTLSKAF